MMQWKYKEKRQEDTDFINENYLFQKFQSFSLESIWIDRTLFKQMKIIAVYRTLLYRKK